MVLVPESPGPNLSPHPPNPQRLGPLRFCGRANCDREFFLKRYLKDTALLCSKRVPTELWLDGRLAFIVDLVGFLLPLSFSPGGCTREEDFMVTLTINKDSP